MKYLIFLALYVFSSLAFSQTLWQKTTFGMSVQQVKKLYPNAVDVIPNAANSYPNGSEPLLKLDNFNLINRDFEVKFAFINQKLNQVVLTCHDLTKSDKDNLYEALVSKYGQPITINKDSVINKFNWASGKTNIYLMVIRDFVQLGYEVRVGKEVDKL